MIALARKYRPKRFSDLLVQDHVGAALRGADLAPVGRPASFLPPQVRRSSTREPRQALAGSSAKRCRASLRGAWGIPLTNVQ